MEVFIIPVIKFYKSSVHRERKKFQFVCRFLFSFLCLHFIIYYLFIKFSFRLIQHSFLRIVFLHSVLIVVDSFVLNVDQLPRPDKPHSIS